MNSRHEAEPRASVVGATLAVARKQEAGTSTGFDCAQLPAQLPSSPAGNCLNQVRATRWVALT